MTESGSLSLHRKFIANTLLSRRKSQLRPRLFLNRNLRLSLDVHEQLKAGLSVDSFSNIGVRSTGNWDFKPSAAMSEELAKCSPGPVLTIDALQMRDPKSRITISQSNFNSGIPPPATPDSDPSWLPTAPYKLNCRAQISIIVALADIEDVASDPKSNEPHKVDKLIDSVQLCTIREQQSDGDLYFDIILDRPFTFSAEVLREARLDRGENVDEPAKADYHDGLKMIFQLSCCDNKDSMTLFSRMPRVPGQNYSVDPDMDEPFFQAIWNSISICPGQHDLVDIALRPNKLENTLIPLSHKFEISMNWTSRGKSALDRHSHLLRQAEIGSQQLATPSSSEQSDAPTDGNRVLWRYREGLDTHNMVVEGFSCPLCDTAMQHSSFDRLHLHLITHHDHFEVEAGLGRMTEADSVSNTVMLSLAELPTEESMDPRSTWQWIAPGHPFDIRAELRGERAYLQKGRFSKGRKRAHDKEVMTSRGRIAIPARPRPEDVIDLPLIRPKRYEVPHVPGVTFYDLLSKRRLRSGEMVVDDEAKILSNSEWLLKSRNASARKLGVKGPALEFMNAFDAFLTRESPSSKMFFNEGLVRFVRQHVEQLARPAWNKAFWKKIDLLRRHGVVKKETYEYCGSKIGRLVALPSVRLVAPSTAGSTDAPAESSSLSTSPSKANKSANTATDTTTPSSVLDKTNCVCGKKATGRGGVIACINPFCRSGPFHMSCVGLTTRPLDWRCLDCIGKR